MKVIPITPRGYCQGVVNALNLVKQAIKNYQNEPIYLLGMIVHNQWINEALNQAGVTTLDDTKTKDQWIETLDHGVLIISAHGVNPSLIEKAKTKGLIVIDATCQYVNIAQQLVLNHLAQGYDIIYIGQQHHPEAQGIIDMNPTKIHLITKLTDLNNLHITNPKILVTTQTTMNYHQVNHLFEAIKTQYPTVEIVDEICDATRLRQHAIEAAPKEIELLYVVGDQYSNNAKKLVEIAHHQGINQVYLIRSIRDITPDQLTNINCVGVTSAASTPTFLTQQVINYLNQYPNDPIPDFELQQLL
jgi:4-hydroxy-3-methylbut-2-en-1-yl diphosphate reductase